MSGLTMSKTIWTKIDEILKGKKTGKTVNIRGWIFRTRSSGNIVFTVIRDVTGIIQATIKKGNLPDKEFEDAKKALIESSLKVEGLVKEDKRAPGGYELQVTSLNIINFAANLITPLNSCFARFTIHLFNGVNPCFAGFAIRGV